MPPGEIPGESLAPFAAEVAGVEAGMDEARTLAALFRRLRDEDFLPDPLAHEAILALAGRFVAPGSLLAEESREAEGRRLQREVEQFASRFFDHPIALRVERYRRLGQACSQHPRPIGRLTALRPALMVDRMALTDASPLVKILLDDLLDLFLLRPGPRAIEARARAERFRSDQKVTEAERQRALKLLAKRHPELVGLLPDYPAGLAKVRRRGSADRVMVQVVGQVVGPSDPFRRAYVLIAVILLGGVGRFLATKPATILPNDPTSSRFSLPAATSKEAIASAVARFHREEFKVPIRRELTRSGKPVDEARLDRIIGQLPPGQPSEAGGLATTRPDGTWSEPVRDHFIARLKLALKAANLGLSEAEVDDLAPRCFPKALPRGKP